jgi:mRNA interferase MazF
MKKRVSATQSAKRYGKWGGLTCPDSSDIVWIRFNSQAGHEQASHRPAVVLSPAAYNAKTSLMVCCPMISQIKNYLFEVVTAGVTPAVVLSDQVKSLDWRKRRARREGSVSADELAEVRVKLRALIG